MKPAIKILCLDFSIFIGFLHMLGHYWENNFLNHSFSLKVAHLSFHYIAKTLIEFHIMYMRLP
jgi:hypothetical protein